jgi:hypothetical protein
LFVDDGDLEDADNSEEDITTLTVVSEIAMVK